jgi:hypothetical protein
MLEKERRHGIMMIFIPLLVMSGAGYFLYALAVKNFFVRWELCFAVGCYSLILLLLLIMDFETLYWMHFKIYLEDTKLKIRDGFFSRPVAIPLDRLYYISSERINGRSAYDSIFITDKKIHHRKIKPLGEEEFSNSSSHLEVVREMRSRYPDEVFYYYRLIHRGYKFMYYFYYMYKVCERCKFSDTSMELVKYCAEAK